jgi:hypothetical protein
LKKWRKKMRLLPALMNSSRANGAWFIDILRFHHSSKSWKKLSIEAERKVNLKLNSSNPSFTKNISTRNWKR